MLKRLALPVLLTFGLCSQLAQAAISSAEAVNLAGMQRMLSQRVAKDYMMIGLDVRPDEARQQMDQAVAKIETNYQALNEYAPSGQIHDELQKAMVIWQEYRTLVLSKPSKTQAVEVLDMSDKLLAQGENITKLVEQNAGTSSAWLINRSGRQRMLSQRIAKLYLARAWNLPVVGIEQQFTTATGEFAKALAELQAAPENTPEIKAALDKAEAQWKFASAGFSLSSGGEFVPTVIAISTETLLTQMQALTVAYTNLLDKK